MSIQISLKKSTTNPTGSSGLTLGEPVFNYGNNTLWVGLGGTTTPVWVGAGVCGASAGIAAGLTTQLPTHAAIKNYFDAVSSGFLGATVSYVATFNGATGAVTGVSSFNGLTGAVTGASLGANTFTALNSFNTGISSAGGTFSANTKFLSGIETDSVLSTTGAGGTLYLNSSASGDGGNSITYIGDWDGANNGTAITVDDQSGLITLNPSISTTNIATGTVAATGSVTIGAAAAFIDTTSTALGTTAANQTIASVEVYDGDALVDTNRSVEFFVQASHSSGYEALKVIAIHDGTNTYNTQYGLIRSGSSLCSSYTTTIVISGGGFKSLRLRATPTNTNTTFKVVETVIPA